MRRPTRRRRELAAYRRTPTWRKLRLERLEMDGYACQVQSAICQEQATEVHHLRYPRKLGTERLSDLVSVCTPCHRVLDGKAG